MHARLYTELEKGSDLKLDTLIALVSCVCAFKRCFAHFMYVPNSHELAQIWVSNFGIKLTYENVMFGCICQGCSYQICDLHV